MEDRKANARGTYRKALVETTTHSVSFSRTRRPITTGVCCRKSDIAAPAAQIAPSRSLEERQLGLWLIPNHYPFAAPTLENRLRMRSSRLSQTSR
jgi:hypothetical protein